MIWNCPLGRIFSFVHALNAARRESQFASFGVKSRYHFDRIAPAEYYSAQVLCRYSSFSVL